MRNSSLIGRSSSRNETDLHRYLSGAIDEECGASTDSCLAPQWEELEASVWSANASLELSELGKCYCATHDHRWARLQNKHSLLVPFVAFPAASSSSSTATTTRLSPVLCLSECCFFCFFLSHAQFSRLESHKYRTRISTTEEDTDRHHDLTWIVGQRSYRSISILAK